MGGRREDTLCAGHSSGNLSEEAGSRRRQRRERGWVRTQHRQRPARREELGVSDGDRGPGVEDGWSPGGRAGSVLASKALGSLPFS